MSALPSWSRADTSPSDLVEGAEPSFAPDHPAPAAPPPAPVPAAPPPASPADVVQDWFSDADGNGQPDLHTGGVTPQNAHTQRADDPIEQAAIEAGFLVLPPDVGVDVEAARLIGRRDDCAGVGFQQDGHLVVAWPDLPTPNQVTMLVQETGHGIYPSVAGKATWNKILWATNELLKDDDFKVELGLLVNILNEQRASDLHLSASERPWLRVGGSFGPIPRFGRISANDMLNLVREVVPDFDPETFSGDKDTSITVGSVRFRVNVYREQGQLGMALRTIPVSIPRFETLGLPSAATKFCGLRDGLVIVAGATGSGKSTSLASLLDIINDEREAHLLTIEAPIEFVHSSKRCLVHQREVGVDTEDFNTALKSALREDPDIILVGEVRDYEEISNAIRLAETGHLVFITIHSHNTAGVIDRIIDVFPSEQQNQIRAQLAGVLRGVIAQKLLPDKNDSRKRWLAYELAFTNDAMRAIISSEEQPNKRITEVITSGRDHGMVPFDGCLARLVAEEKVSREEAMRSSVDPDLLDTYISAALNNKARQATQGQS
jgi:twitching motility protein PilT